MTRPGKRELQEQFRVFNADFFGGRLPDVPVVWRRMSAFGCAYSPCKRYPHGHIALSTSLWPYNPDAKSGWRGTLAHEMIHIALDGKGVDEFEHGDVAFHGPRFAAECNRIGGLLGLRPVDEAEAWHWPHFWAGWPEPSDEE